MSKFRVELWRIVKFILITLVVTLPLTLLSRELVNAWVGSGKPGVGNWLSAISYGQLFLSTAALTLLHRYFTFRATEKWFIALPFMLIATALWQFLQALTLTYAAKLGTDAIAAISVMLPVLWGILQYLLQRCVIYCHTTDQNGWYRRFHPDTE